MTSGRPRASVTSLLACVFRPLAWVCLFILPLLSGRITDTSRQFPGGLSSELFPRLARRRRQPRGERAVTRPPGPTCARLRARGASSYQASHPFISTHPPMPTMYFMIVCLFVCLFLWKSQETWIKPGPVSFAWRHGDQTEEGLKREGYRKRQLLDSSIAVSEVKAGRCRSGAVLLRERAWCPG